jgi:hypothetical protein
MGATSPWLLWLLHLPDHPVKVALKLALCRMPELMLWLRKSCIHSQPMTVAGHAVGQIHRPYLVVEARYEAQLMACHYNVGGHCGIRIRVVLCGRE